MRRPLLTIALIFACQQHSRSIDIATTTSMQGSGLFEVLRKSFAERAGIDVRAFVVGSGQALKLADKGTVDLTITHDPEAEQQFVTRTRPELYRQFMWNDFVIVGPPNDPARISTSRSAAEAFFRIHNSAGRFVSRNDQSGTHMKELRLWKMAGVDPGQNSGYFPMGQPMAHLLRSADELRAYTLSDQATFDQLAPRLNLKVLMSGDPVLRNIYAVILMRRPENRAHRDARTFAHWLLSEDGRSVIEAYRIRGRQEFFSFTISR